MKVRWAINKPFSYKHGGQKYKFVLTSPLEVVLPEEIVSRWADKAPLRAGDRQGRCWLTLAENSAIVSEGYASDGCSPKKKIFNTWVGTPDFDPGTIAASTIHDALYQTMHLEDYPLTVQEIDEIFFRIMEFNKFPLRSVYYHAVNKFGPYFYKGGSENIVWL